MSDQILTSAGFHCPACQSESKLSYKLIPSSRLHFTIDGEDHVHYFGPLRDYKCRNCDHEWLQSDQGY